MMNSGMHISLFAVYVLSNNMYSATVSLNVFICNLGHGQRVDFCPLNAKYHAAVEAYLVGGSAQPNLIRD